MAEATKIAQSMVETNREWASKENVKLDKFLALLPVPEDWKRVLKRVFNVTGYDWFGTFMGRVAKRQMDLHWGVHRTLSPHGRTVERLWNRFAGSRHNTI